MQKLTASLEDYLEIIYNNMENQSIFRAVDISRKLNVSRASVTEALKKLVMKGYITYDRHDSITLTPEGKKLAASVASKHTILQNFFEKVLLLSEDEASHNACKIEHVITNKAFESIKKYMEEKQIS